MDKWSENSDIITIIVNTTVTNNNTTVIPSNSHVGGVFQSIMYSPKSFSQQLIAATSELIPEPLLCMYRLYVHNLAV